MADDQMSWKTDVDHVTDLAVAGCRGHGLSPRGFANQQSLCHLCGPHREENGLNDFSARKCGRIEIKPFRRSSSSLMTSSVGLLERMVQLILFPVNNVRAGDRIFYFIFIECYQDVKCCPRNIFIKSDVLKTPCRLLAAPAQGPATELDVQQTCLFSVLEEQEGFRSQSASPSSGEEGQRRSFSSQFFLDSFSYFLIFIF